MEKKIEIEKRLLLKGLPAIIFDEIHTITQWYTPNGRLRQSNIMICKTGETRLEYIKTIKTAIDSVQAYEQESEMKEYDFILGKASATKCLRKTRYVKYVDGLKWEIDVFSFKLVIAEIEVKSIEDLDKIEIPDYIKKLLIKDITGIKEFSNFNLADEC